MTSKQVSQSRKSRKGQNTINALQSELQRRKDLSDKVRTHEFDRQTEALSQIQGGSPVKPVHPGYEKQSENGAPENDVNISAEFEDQNGDSHDYRQQEDNYTQSRYSGKSYAKSLKHEIEEERKRRLELEQQIEKLKQFNKSITSKLGIDYPLK